MSGGVRPDLFRGLFDCGQLKPKPAAAIGNGFDATFAAHAMHGFCDDRQADAGAFELLRIAGALEDAEYLL